MTDFNRRQFLDMFETIGVGRATVDPASLADGVGATSSVTVTGAALGDFVMFAAPYDLAGTTVTAYVSAANTVAIRVQNESAGGVNLASGVWKVIVLRMRGGFPVHT